MRLAGPALGALLCALTRVAGAQPPPGALPPPPSYQMSLGSYEKVALERALAARHLRLEPHPYGKMVRWIHVVNQDVFGPDEGFLRWFNIFHRTSREHVVEREVLLRPGQIWDDEVVDETRRRLKDPLFTTLVVIAPVVAERGGPEEVDLLVVTRDIWSLRANSRYEVQEGVLTELSLSLSENNLLGYRKQVAIVFDMDLGAFNIGPQYVDENIAGTHLQLLSRVDGVFRRADGEREGSRSYTSFGYPLWSLEREYGAGVVITHFNAVRRSFEGPELRLYDNPDTPEVEAIPYEFHERDFEIETSGVRQLGHAVKHRVTLGHDLTVRRPEVLDSFPGDDVAQAAFERDVLPRSERASRLFARYSFFTPWYRVYRNIDSFDLAEDVQLGPEASLELGAAREEIGSEANFFDLAASAAWTQDIIGDGIARVSASAVGRRQEGEYIDEVLSAGFSAASPPLLGMRLAARSLWARRYNETNNRFFTVGGDTGLRGYTIGDFAGQIRVLNNLELRTFPIRILFARFGGIAFWDFGHAADCYSGCDNPLVLQHDVGVGLRGLVPQLQPYVFRLDWAVPLTGPTRGFAGSRVIFGVQQVF
jgi:hypothetical protein